MYSEEVMPKGLENLVVGLCADYGRRGQIIKRRSATYGVIMQCRFLNYKIYNAACQIAGDADAEVFIREIGERVGYSRSKLSKLSEIDYKKRKAAIKRNIAKELLLM